MSDFVATMNAFMAKRKAATTPEGKREAEREMARYLQECDRGRRSEPVDWARKAANMKDNE